MVTILKMDFFYLSMLQWCAIFLLTILTGLYFYLTHSYDYFEKRGIPFVKGAKPLFGNVIKTATFFESHILDIQKHYLHFKNARFFGHYEFMTPVYYIRDPFLVKQISIKDFENFQYHRVTIDEGIDPMISKNLFLVKTKKWRPMRTTLSPVFTGSKMREMFVRMGDYLRVIIKDFREEYKDKPVELDMKDFYTRMGHDILANAAFGIKSNSFADRDNKFYRIGHKVRNFEGMQTVKFFGFLNFPKIMKFLRIKFYDSDVTEFMRYLSKTAISQREQSNVPIQDFTNIVKNAKYNGFHYEDITKEGSILDPNVSEWDSDDLASQYLVFQLAGFQVVSQMMCFASHELACNPDVQDRLRKEIDEVRESLNGEIPTYDTVMAMPYLDMVVSENLRKWPPVVTVDRECTKPYVMEDYAGKKHQLKVGDSIVFPIFAIHNDPALFPNPSKFDPERFSPERKQEIDPDSYIPFGVGPRMCIGNRFALMEAKINLFHLLSAFIIEKSPKTDESLTLSTQAINLIPKNGFWLQFRVRNDV